jgi:hypothetical protein
MEKGRNPETIPLEIEDSGVIHDSFWPDFIREVDRSGNTVWEWHSWDHIGTGPKELDINYTLPRSIGGTYWNFDWTHCNAVGFIEDTGQVILNSRNFSEFFLIDYETGEIEYRWGNPCTHGSGKCPSFYDDGDQKVFGSHNANFLENGNMLVFDNGSERPQGNRSRVVEVDLETSEIVWEFEANDSTSFFSYRQGAAQRLPNGNTLITSTNHGHIFEVTQKKEVVWEYVSPIFEDGLKCVIEDSKFLHNFMSNHIHRAYRYGTDFPGLKDKDLSKRGVLVLGCPEFWRIYGVTE